MTFKKILIPLVSLAALLTALAVYLVFFKPAPVYKAIPASAIAVIDLNNPARFQDKLATTYPGSVLKQTTALIKLEEEISIIDSLWGKTPVLSGQKATISVHLTSADDFDYLFVTRLTGMGNEEVLQTANHSNLIKSTGTRVFRGQSVVDLTLTNGRQITFGIKRGVFALSFTPFITESAFTAFITGGNVMDDHDFKTALNHCNKLSNINLLLNYKNADIIAPLLFKPGKTLLPTNLKGAFTWGAYSLSLENGFIKLEGGEITLAENKTENNTAGPGTIADYIPAGAAYINISQVQDNENSSKQGNLKLGEEYFTGWAGNEKAFVILEPLKEDYSDNNLFVISVTNREKAIDNLGRLMALDGITTIPDTLGGHLIYHLKSGNLLNKVFGGNFTNFGNVWFTVTDKAAVFCNNPDVLKLALEKIDKKETINTEPAF
ncbi:MAG TPA: hypothetical protein VG603_08930, partial [Chitinophagales bacterium]|nr:hypothetical protein [Chitinophagales bacterium]